MVAPGTVIEYSSFDLEMMSVMPDTWPLMEPKDGGVPGDVDLRGGSGGDFYLLDGLSRLCKEKRRCL